jgi:Heavy metal associated domain 2
MQPELLLVIVSTIGTAIWTVLTWAEQEEKERRSEEDQIDTLYVNPFLLAAEELQMLLYNLLAEKEIEWLRTGVSHEGDNPNSISDHETLEIIYQFVKFFGWSICFYRFGSYSQDKDAILMARKICLMFADRETFGDDPFRFSLAKQHALGRQFVKRISSTSAEQMTEFYAATLYEFDEKVMQSKQESGPLYQDLSLLINIISNTTSSKKLPGRARLSAIQSELVNLITYIESKEKFTLTNEIRKKTKLLGNKIIITEAPIVSAKSDWIPAFFNFTPIANQNETIEKAQVIHNIPGRVRLKVPWLNYDQNYANELISWIEKLPEIKSVQANRQASSLTIQYDQNTVENIASILLDKINNILTLSSEVL